MSSSTPSPDANAGGEPVSLYIYDLSNGLAAMWGQALTGRPVEGIWHTSLVLYGMEVFFGQGISIVSPPGTTHHGVPKKKLSCGVTHLDKETFLEYIEGLRETYTADAYHLLEFNCNTFTNDVLSFLNSSSIPSYILSQPSEIMSTPFGAQMRPMIEQMFVGRRTASAGRAEIGRLTSQLGMGGLPTPAPTPPSAESVASNLQIVTSAASLRSTLAASPSVIVLYTHPSSSASSIAKTTFESLAREYGRTKFVLVETHLAHDGAKEFADLGLKKGEGETLALFARGRCVKPLPSPSPDALEDKIKWLEDRLWLTHPHSSLGLSHLDALVSRARKGEGLTSWKGVPKRDGLERKSVEEVVGAAFEVERRREEVCAVMRGAVGRVFEAAQGGKGVELDEEAWGAAIETLEALSTAEKLDAPLFPLIDLLRLAFSLPTTSVSPITLASLPQLIAALAGTLDSRSSAPSFETDLLTSLKLISNLLTSLKLISNLLSPAFQPPALTARVLAPDCLPSLTRLVLHALLSPPSSSASKLPLVAAQTAFSLVARVCEERMYEEDVGGEEWEVEVASAVVEALGGAEDGEILHHLTNTLGTLLFLSPHFASVQSLLEVLETDAVLARVEERTGKAERELVREVRRLVKSGGEA
ncbi:hypothetical protein NBRC10513v2_003227 [Rhodotorula toruloides]